jgi:predicted dehydrogenase
MNGKQPSSDRRRFLISAAAAAMGCPVFVPSHALGRGGVAASERIGLAYLGPGNRGRQLVREFAMRPDVESLLVCDPQRDRRQLALAAQREAGERRPQGPGTCGQCIDFREALARSDVDAVVVSAPEFWRPILCILAAKAGKDIYTEKPYSLTIGEGRAMFEAVRRHGRVFQHGTQRRSNNEQGLRDSCELARNGRLGKLTHATVWVGPGPTSDRVDYTAWPPPPPRDVLDWDLWLGPAPLRPYSDRILGWNWHITRNFGLGSIGNWGAHTLDMAQWALGKDAESPVAALPPGAAGPHLVLRYADGLEIRVPRTKGDCSDVAVFGSAGQKIILGRPPVTEEYDETPLGPSDLRLYRADRGDHLGNWLQCIRTRGSTICNEEVGLRSGLLCHLIDIVDRLQRPLKFDPARLEFPGDDEAQRLSDTPKRSPWQIY